MSTDRALVLAPQSERITNPDVASRLEVKLARFKLGNSEVWMPISGTSLGYAIRRTGSNPATDETPIGCPWGVTAILGKFELSSAC